MIRIGPFWILSRRERNAYRLLSNRAYALHQAVWYSQEPNEAQWAYFKALDTELSAALSRIPASDIDTPI